MTLERGRENELCLWVVFDEAGWCESLDWRTVVKRLVPPTSTFSVTFLHAAASSAICFAHSTALGSAERLRRVQNRPVTGTPAEVAVKGLFHLELRRVVLVPKQSVRAHDNTRRAETALASIPHSNPLLHRMRPLHRSDPLHCDDMFSVNAHERRQAGVYAGVVYLFCCRVVLGDNHCAGAAASFCTPEFGACESDATEVFEEGYFWVGLVECDFGAVKVEDDRVVPVLRHGVEGADL